MCSCLTEMNGNQRCVFGHALRVKARPTVEYKWASKLEADSVVSQELSAAHPHYLASCAPVPLVLYGPPTTSNCVSTMKSSTIVVYGENHCHVTRAIECLAPGYPVHKVATWDQFCKAAPHATVIVAVIPHLGDHRFKDICAFKARNPLKPIVLVIEKDADNARNLVGIAAEGVVWLHEEAQELRREVGRVSQIQHHLRRIADNVETQTHIAEKLRKALALACRNESAIRRVDDLARAANCGRSTLCLLWRRSVRDSSGHKRLKDFLDWLIVLRAVESKNSDASWERVANDLEMHGPALARLTKRVTGQTLRALTQAGPRFVVALFLTTFNELFSGQISGALDEVV